LNEKGFAYVTVTILLSINSGLLAFFALFMTENMDEFDGRHEFKDMHAGANVLADDS
jgi:hypothetical protein